MACVLITLISSGASGAPLYTAATLQMEVSLSFGEGSHFAHPENVVPKWMPMTKRSSPVVAAMPSGMVCDMELEFVR